MAKESDIISIAVGETWRHAGMVAKASGSAITAGIVQYFLKAKTGANAGKWWKDSDGTWAAVETANAMSHDADGNWTIELSASPFADGIVYVEYAKESGNLHVAGEGRLLRGQSPITGLEGIYTQTVTVKTSGAVAIPNATVQLWSGETLVSTKTTNASGIAYPQSNAGAFTLKVSCAGYNDYSAALTVAGNATVGVITLTAFSVTPSSTGFVTGYLTCYGTSGSVAAGIIATLEVVEGAGTAGISVPTTTRTATSGADGIAQFTGIPWGAEVLYERGSGKKTRARAPTSGTSWALPEADGTP